MIILSIAILKRGRLTNRTPAPPFLGQLMMMRINMTNNKTINMTIMIMIISMTYLLIMMMRRIILIHLWWWWILFNIWLVLTHLSQKLNAQAPPSSSSWPSSASAWGRSWSRGRGWGSRGWRRSPGRSTQCSLVQVAISYIFLSCLGLVDQILNCLHQKIFHVQYCPMFAFCNFLW